MSAKAAEPVRPGTKWFPGMRVGSLTLLVRRPLAAHSRPRGWTAVCDCGKKIECVNPATSTARNPGGAKCRRCESKARRQPRLCRTCGTRNRKKFAKTAATECMACQRRAVRNGRCDCGRAIGFTNLGLRRGPLPCPCTCQAVCS